jgi:FdrA protein
VLVEPNRYFDSVFLMRISREIEELPDVAQAVVAMATPANVENIVGAGFQLDRSTTPQDLLIAIDSGSEEGFSAARERLDALLAGSAEPSGVEEVRPGSLREALEVDPSANLALISVPGEYAAREARLALRRGLHVMLFSDNVSVEDEIALKADAVERGLLMMGPDCGTAILNGVPLGFANVCRRGSVGIVGASGTGIQEVSSLIHWWGGGISHAIGTGGRDLSAKVGAAMTRFGIRALGENDATRVVVVVSKAPDRAVIPGLLETLAEAGKPGVVHFVGFDPEDADPSWPGGRIRFAATLEEATSLGCEQGGYDPEGPQTIPIDPPTVDGNILGLYCGGTLCQEAWAILRRAGLDVVSNVAFDQAMKVRPGDAVSGHALWDLGDDDFTVGTPHPMIEPSLRDERVAAAGADPEVGLVLVDCVLGYGAHPDPAGSLAGAARAAISSAKAEGRTLYIVASVTGTDLDPQHAPTQRTTLEEAGILVAGSNANAVRIARQYLRGGAE